MTQQQSFASMTHEEIPPQIKVYEIASRRLYVKTGVRNFAISEDDVTPEELVSIAKDMAARQEARCAVGSEGSPPIGSKACYQAV